MRKIIVVILGLILLLVAVGVWLSYKPVLSKITYGMSFNTLYANELHLDWKKTYDAILDDLGVRHLRLAAHWNLVEPEDDKFNFTELDYQLDKAEAVGADVVFGVGRRLPRWPECHIPDWASDMSWEEQKPEILEYLTVVVNRYKDRPSIIYWQVENEPYLNLFANEYCGNLDEDFLKAEIKLVKEIDPTRPVLITDSGNLGTWYAPYRDGDAFGTSVYVYFWNPTFGQFRSLLPAWWYRLKEGVIAGLFGKKPTFLIELSVEPWLIEPVVDVDLDTQYSRMDLDKINNIIDYAAKTRYDKQYLWGAEWWYWLKQQGHPEIWERGKELFK